MECCCYERVFFCLFWEAYEDQDPEHCTVAVVNVIHFICQWLQCLG